LAASVRVVNDFAHIDPRPNVCSRALSTRSVGIDVATRRPMIRRAKTSIRPRTRSRSRSRHT
jgi:hypothetical protein